MDLSKILEKQIQALIQSLIENFGFNIIAVFDLKNQTVINIYIVNNFLINEELNRKSFFIKGKVIDLNALTNKNNWQYSIREDVEKLPTVQHTFSENMFGYIGFGLVNY